MKTELEIKKVPIKQLKFAPYNPRKMDEKEFEKLKRSIAEFGYVEPLVVNKRTMHVVGGNQRLKALKELGFKLVDVVFVDLDDYREKALNIALNKISGQWDIPKLKELLVEIDTGLFDIELTGFDFDEIEKMIYFPEDDKEEHEEEVEIERLEQIGEAVVSRGDVWELGKHRLMCGDATNREDVEILMNGEKADMVFTDPPFEMEDTYSDILFEITKENAHIFVMTSERVLVQIIYKHFKYFSRLFAVDFKTATITSNHGPATRVDFIAEFSKGKNKFRNLHDCFSTLLEVPKFRTKKAADDFSFKHAKKVKLPRMFILHYTNPNELVVDLFGGVGSTLIAAEKTKRRCYIMEIDPLNCTKTIKRWEMLTGQKAKRVNGM